MNHLIYGRMMKQVLKEVGQKLSKILSKVGL